MHREIFDHLSFLVKGTLVILEIPSFNRTSLKFIRRPYFTMGDGGSFVSLFGTDFADYTVFGFLLLH